MLNTITFFKKINLWLTDNQVLKDGRINNLLLPSLLFSSKTNHFQTVNKLEKFLAKDLSFSKTLKSGAQSESAITTIVSAFYQE